MNQYTPEVQNAQGLTPRLLKAEEIASILQISRTQAYRLLATGEIPSVRFGQLVRVRAIDLDRFIALHLTEHPQESPQ